MDWDLEDRGFEVLLLTWFSAQCSMSAAWMNWYPDPRTRSSASVYPSTIFPLKTTDSISFPHFILSVCFLIHLVFLSLTLRRMPWVWSPACVLFWRSCSWSWSPRWTAAAAAWRWQTGRAVTPPYRHFPACGSVRAGTSGGPERSTPGRERKKMTLLFLFFTEFLDCRLITTLKLEKSWFQKNKFKTFSEKKERIIIN